MQSRSTTRALLLLVPVLALAGCGGHSQRASRAATTRPAQSPAAVVHRYEQQMQVLGNALSSYFRTVGEQNRNASRTQIVANLQHVQARLRAASKKLKAMTPPPRIAVAHRRLVAAVLEYAGELDEIIAEIRGGDRTALGKIPRLKGILDMGTATQAIVHAGYDITGPPAAVPSA